MQAKKISPIPKIPSVLETDSSTTNTDSDFSDSEFVVEQYTFEAAAERVR